MAPHILVRRNAIVNSAIDQGPVFGNVKLANTDAKLEDCLQCVSLRSQKQDRYQNSSAQWPFNGRTTHHQLQYPPPLALMYMKIQIIKSE